MPNAFVILSIHPLICLSVQANANGIGDKFSSTLGFIPSTLSAPTLVCSVAYFQWGFVMEEAYKPCLLKCTSVCLSQNFALTLYALLTFQKGFTLSCWCVDNNTAGWILSAGTILLAGLADAWMHMKPYKLHCWHIRSLNETFFFYFNVVGVSKGRTAFWFHCSFCYVPCEGRKKSPNPAL